MVPPSTARTDYSNVVAPFSAGGMDAAVALKVRDLRAYVGIV